MDKNTNNKGNFGVLSLMAMIIGIVIGSGIFVKNVDLVAANGSIVLTMITWLVGALIVVSMAIAFLEIMSITEITGEQATLTNWGRHLMGYRMGNMIGYYITLVYFPMVMAAIAYFAGSTLLDITQDNGWTDFSTEQYQLLCLGFAVTFLAVIITVNSLSVKPGQYFQNIGTIVKTIPLFFIIILVIVLFITGDVSIPTEDMIPDGEGEEAGKSNLGLIIMVLPSILFSIDGFLLAGSLSKEGKSKNSFRTAFIISIIFILIIYITFSLATLFLGDPNPDTQYGDYGSITNTIYSVFGDNVHLAQVLSVTTNLIIVMSILVGLSGCFITATRMYSDLSAHNLVVDKKFRSITKNKAGVSTTSGSVVGLNIAVWIAVATIMDVVNIVWGSGSQLNITGFMSNIIIVGAFIFYAIVIGAGLVNRFTKRCEVKKNALFIPAAIIASLLTFGITLLFAYQILAPPAEIKFDTHAEWVGAMYAWALQLGFTLIWIVFSFGVNFYLTKKVNATTKEFVDEKMERVADYNGEMPQEILDELKESELSKEA